MKDNTKEFLEVDQSTICTANILIPKICQQCLLCENTHEIPSYSHYMVPWVCDECKEVMAFARDFKKQAESSAQSNRKEDPNENICPL